MGILDKSQNITKGYLKKAGWDSGYWGSKPNWGPTKTFWERQIVFQKGAAEYIAYLVYFPDNFDGYVTSFSDKGISPAGNLYCYDMVGYSGRICWRMPTKDILDLQAGEEVCIEYLKSLI